MSFRDRWIDRMERDVQDGQEQLYIALVTSDTNGQFEVKTNGRSTVRTAVESNEFGFHTAGTGKGDEVLVIASEQNDLAQIIGLSPWSVH